MLDKKIVKIIKCILNFKITTFYLFTYMPLPMEQMSNEYMRTIVKN